MAVFRVERTHNYTVMSNYHLRDKSLSLKAKGLLSQMLSLPEDWNYTLAGLARINAEGKDAIRAAVVELEKAGYVQSSAARPPTRPGNSAPMSTLSGNTPLLTNRPRKGRLRLLRCRKIR